MTSKTHGSRTAWGEDTAVDVEEPSGRKDDTPAVREGRPARLAAEQPSGRHDDPSSEDTGNGYQGARAKAFASQEQLAGRDKGRVCGENVAPADRCLCIHDKWYECYVLLETVRCACVLP